MPPFEEGLLGQCRQRHDRRSAVVSAAVAAVMPPPHDRSAASIASELSRAVGGLPEWVRTVGLVQPSRGWVASDVFGDQDSLIVAYRQQGSPHEHALIVLVDHNLSGQAKDAWICTNADDAVARWMSSDDPRLRVREAVVDEVLRRLRDAMAASDLWDGDAELRTEDFAEHRAMIWSRLRRAGLSDERIAVPEVTPGERGAIVAEFLVSPEGRSLAGELDGTDVEKLTHYLVDLRCDYEGRPLRWSPIVVSLVLGDLAPRKLLLDSGEAAALPEVVRALLRFSGARTGLDREFVEESLVAVDQVEATFLERIADPAAAGPAKAVLAELRDRGVDITDLEALKEALGQGVVMPAPRLASKRKRRTADASRDVVAEAADTQVLTRFDALVGFYVEGRNSRRRGSRHSRTPERSSRCSGPRTCSSGGPGPHVQGEIGGRTRRARLHDPLGARRLRAPQGARQAACDDDLGETRRQASPTVGEGRRRASLGSARSPATTPTTGTAEPTRSSTSWLRASWLSFCGVRCRSKRLSTGRSKRRMQPSSSCPRTCGIASIGAAPSAGTSISWSVSSDGPGL